MNERRYFIYYKGNNRYMKDYDSSECNSIEKKCIYHVFGCK